MIHSTPSRSQAACPPKLRRRRPLFWGGLVALALAVAWQAATSGTLLAADSLTLSRPWRFVDESKPGSPEITGDLAVAAADAPAPVAAHFDIRSTMQALALQLDDTALGGVALAQVKELSYCTRLIDSPLPYAVTLQVNIDVDVTDGDKSWQGRLVYTPADNGAIIQDKWQCWDTLAGKWWATGGPLAEFAKEGSPQSLSSLLARFPHLGVNAAYSVMVLKAGAGWSRFQGEATPVVIGVEGDKIDIAFASTPHDPSPANEVLLPVLLNQAPIVPPSAQDEPNRGHKEDKKEDNKQQDKGKQQDKDDKKFDWRATDWAATGWAGFDWQHFDWSKVDWASLDWGALGWDDSAHADVVRAFVNDVQTCKDNGWQSAGFYSAGDCVAYYIKVHAPADFDWRKFGWARVWMDYNDKGDHGLRHGRDRRSDDD